MKKMIALGLLLCIVLSLFSMTAMADDAQSATVYVTVVTLEENTQRIVLAQKAVTVTDADGDGTLTMNDALYLAHEASYAGGAAAGYAFSQGAYGLQLDKLWGIANGGSYGMDLNDRGANGIGDTVADGDYVTAYVYAYGVCDTYAYFDKKTVSGEEGSTVELTLYANTYDMTTWELVSSPVAHAEILVDNVESAYRTDANGKVTITLDNAGEHTVSARKDGMGLVRPVCVTYVSPRAEDSTQSGSNGQVTLPELELPETKDDSSAKTEDDGGCGSVMSGAGLLLTTLAAGFMTVRRRRDEI